MTRYSQKKKKNGGKGIIRKKSNGHTKNLTSDKSGGSPEQQGEPVWLGCGEQGVQVGRGSCRAVRLHMESG